MLRSIDFEFHAYDGDDNGWVASRPNVTFETLADKSAARNRAGRIAKRCKGPVDLAYAGFEPWGERYLTTASPSPFHKSGYRFERIA